MEFLRYEDLVKRGILRNRMTLKRWIDDLNFPPGFLIGPNTRVYPRDQVEAWLSSRAAVPQKARIAGMPPPAGRRS